MNRTILKKLSYIGAQINQGQYLKGVETGPNVIRQSGVFETLKNIYKLQAIKDYGNINFEGLSEQQRSRKPIQHMVQNLHVLDPLLKKLSNKLQQAHRNKQQDQVILTVGGDHSIGSATIHAALQKNPNLKVIWVDAHPDFVNPFIKNTPDQKYHGMPLSHISGVHNLPGFQWMKRKIDPKNIVMIGIRDIDDDQYHSIKKYNVKAFTMDHVTKFGIGQVMKRTLQYLDPHGQSPFHISYDLDAVDPSQVSQTGTVYRDGLSHREACHVVRRVVNQRKLVSLDVVQLNVKRAQNIPRDHYRDQQYYNKQISKTTGMAVDLITSLANRNLTL